MIMAYSSLASLPSRWIAQVQQVQPSVLINLYGGSAVEGSSLDSYGKSPFFLQSSSKIIALPVRKVVYVPRIGILLSLL